MMALRARIGNGLFLLDDRRLLLNSRTMLRNSILVATGDMSPYTAVSCTKVSVCRYFSR